MPFLVDWWDGAAWYRREGQSIEHAQRCASPELLAMYNRPQSVVNLQKLRDNVMALMGFK